MGHRKKGSSQSYCSSHKEETHVYSGSIEFWEGKAVQPVPQNKQEPESTNDPMKCEEKKESNEREWHSYIRRKRLGCVHNHN